MSEIRNEPEFETSLELDRLVMQCSKDECEGRVLISPPTAQLYLDPTEPKYDHVLSRCSETRNGCEQRTMKFLGDMACLDTIYDFEEKKDVTYFNYQIGTYAKKIREIYSRLHPPPPEVELIELTPRQENLVNYFAYLLADEYTVYKEF